MAHNKAPVKWVLLHAVGPCTAVPQQFKYLQSFLTVDHPGGQSLPVACQEQSRFNYNKTVYTSFTRVKLKCPAQMSRETEPLYWGFVVCQVCPLSVSLVEVVGQYLDMV